MRHGVFIDIHSPIRVWKKTYAGSAVVTSFSLAARQTIPRTDFRDISFQEYLPICVKCRNEWIKSVYTLKVWSDEN